MKTYIKQYNDCLVKIYDQHEDWQVKAFKDGVKTLERWITKSTSIEQVQAECDKMFGNGWIVNH